MLCCALNNETSWQICRWTWSISVWSNLSPILERHEPLTELVERDLLLFSPPDEYTFKHTLTQEVAYESLSFSRRRELHVSVGTDIEQRRAGDLAEYYSVLARHFDRGQAFDKAFTYLVEAGGRAQSEFANEAALDDYRRALEIATQKMPSLPDLDEQHLNVLEAMGDIHLLVGRYDEALEHFQHAIDLDPVLGGSVSRDVVYLHTAQPIRAVGGLGTRLRAAHIETVHRHAGRGADQRPDVAGVGDVGGELVGVEECVCVLRTA